MKKEVVFPNKGRESVVATKKVGSEGGKYSVFEYQYRDSGNYKVFGKVLLTGMAGGSDMEVIESSCDWGGRFVAEQVGVPVLYHELYQFSGGPTEDDVAFHEALQVRSATAEECKEPLWGSLTDLLARFRSVKYWNCRLSPHGSDSFGDR